MLIVMELSYLPEEMENSVKNSVKLDIVAYLKTIFRVKMRKVRTAIKKV